MKHRAERSVRAKERRRPEHRAGELFLGGVGLRRRIVRPGPSIVLVRRFEHQGI